MVRGYQGKSFRVTIRYGATLDIDATRFLVVPPARVIVTLLKVTGIVVLKHEAFGVRQISNNFSLAPIEVAIEVVQLSLITPFAA